MESDKDRESEANQQLALIKQLANYFRPIAIVIILLNFTLGIDYFLPWQAHDQQIISVKKILASINIDKYAGEPVHEYDEINFTDFTLRFPAGKLTLIDEHTNAIVHATTFLSKPMYATITLDDATYNYYPEYNVYSILGYLIPVMIILGILFFVLKKPMFHLNLAIILLLFFFIQVFLFFGQ